VYSSRPPRMMVWAKGLIEEMAGEKISGIQEELKRRRETSEGAYRAELAQFVRALKDRPSFASLSFETQKKLSELPEALGVPTVDVVWIEREWDEAEGLQRRVESGEILTNFGGHFRRMGRSMNGDRWVIEPNGNLRNPDEVKYRKRYISEGDKFWRIVAPEELALSWNYGHETYGVRKRPVSGLTKAQLQAVAQIEEEIGAIHGSFGLDPEANARSERLGASIQEACKRSHLLAEVPDLAGHIGEGWEQEVTGVCVTYPWDFVRHAEEFTEQCARREAQLVDLQPAGEGMVEFLVYYKYGSWNLNIRWRLRRPDEPTDESPPPKSGGETDPSDLSRLFRGAAKIRR
jgi:hypothetical protein